MKQRLTYAILLFSVIVIMTWWQIATAQFSCIDLLKENGLANSHHRPHKNTSTPRYIYELDGASPGASEVLNEYQTFQSIIFEKRLHKFQLSLLPKKIAVRNQDLLDRSKSIYVVILKSKLVKNKTPEFVGGIRAVYAKNPTEKLPFEIDLSVKRADNKKGFTSVEIGRLTNLEPNDLLFGANSTTALLIDRILRNVLKDPNLEWVYVHTSATHVRLYRLLGFVPEKISAVDELNQVMQFSAEKLKLRLGI